MSLTDSAFPSSAAFDLIAESLSTDAAKQNALKSGGKAVFAFVLKNKSGATQTWYLDLKETATVGKGAEAPGGKKADVTLSMSDEDFGKLVRGEVQGQRLFMGGRMKVKGDIMKATKADGVLKAAQKPKAKL